MRNRIVAAAGVLTIALVGSCTSRPPTQIASTASVTVNGNDRNFHVVQCSQREWTRTIDIGSDFAGAKLIIDESSQPATVESVHIQNLGGFTGMYSRGGDGDAGMSMNGDKFTVSGTANGYLIAKPGEPATATYKINVSC